MDMWFSAMFREGIGRVMEISVRFHLRKGRLYVYVINYFSYFHDKIPDKSQLRMRVLFWLVVCGEIVYCDSGSMRKLHLWFQRERNAGAQLELFLFQATAPHLS